MQKSSINYRQIYLDILESKFPHKKRECMSLLEKRNLSAMDVIILNKRIFGIIDKETELFNQKHRSYNENDILQILNYQNNHKLNNSQLATHFKLSRNTIAKWRKIFL